jgi:hypothetical protein
LASHSMSIVASDYWLPSNFEVGLTHCLWTSMDITWSCI